MAVALFNHHIEPLLVPQPIRKGNVKDFTSVSFVAASGLPLPLLIKGHRPAVFHRDPIMTEQKPDRREFKRVSSLNLVSLELLDDRGNVAKIVIGITLDLSVKGTKLEIDEPVPFLSDIKFQIALKENILKVKGKVVYLNRIEEKKFHCGVQFHVLSPKDKALIEDFLKRSKASDLPPLN